MFKGSNVALITPFKNNELDVEAYIKLIHLQISNGTNGLVPAGTTGESPTLSHDEHQKVIDLCVKESNGKTVVIAGTGSNSTKEAISLTTHAEKAGADAALIVTPYYNKPTQEGLYQHYEIARFYNVYGPNEVVDGDWAAVIGIWRRQVRDGEKITIVGDGEQRRDFTHVVDIVDGLYKIGMTDESHDDAWELGTGTNYSINEMYSMFKKKFGTDHVSIPDQPGNYRVTLRENNDTVERLEWEPKDRLQTYIDSL